MPNQIPETSGGSSQGDKVLIRGFERNPNVDADPTAADRSDGLMTGTDVSRD